VHIKSIATDLKALADKLEVSSSRGTANAGSLMRTFAFDCKAVADELLRALQKLANEKPGSK
jgi:hypothetical protein